MYELRCIAVFIKDLIVLILHKHHFLVGTAAKLYSAFYKLHIMDALIDICEHIQLVKAITVMILMPTAESSSVGLCRNTTL